MALRAASFGSQAAAYADHRPDYPGAAITWALEPVLGRARPRVLDLAAGTGKLTDSLVRRDISVVAVEPDPEMLAELRRRVPQAESMPGTAERIPLPDGSVDAILVGQALHWFDLDRAMPEMARVLNADGVVGALWNRDDDRVPWVRGLKEVSTSSMSADGWRLDLLAPPGSHFPEIEQAEFPHVQYRTSESLVKTITTHSHLLVLPDPEHAQVRRRIHDYLASRPETACGEFQLPIRTTVIRAIRA